MLRKFLKENFQILYPILLILLIPTFIFLNTYISIKAFKKVLDIEIEKQALNIGRTIGEFFEDIEEKDKLNYYINKIQQGLKDIVSLDIIKKQGEKFVIIASVNKNSIGKESSLLQNAISWHNNEPIASLIKTSSPSVSDEDIKNPKYFSNERFWLVTVPIGTLQNKSLIAVKISSKIVDDLVSQILLRSYIVLTITILIAILLVAVNFRLFSYLILYKKLKEVDKMKDDFISIASHELRTPITVIRGYIQYLFSKDVSKKELRQILETIYNSIERLNDLVSDLLDVSRIEQKRLKLKFERVDLQKEIDKLVKEFKIQAKEKGLKIFWETKGEVGNIYADKAKFKQIMVNLIGNSIKYTFKGHIKIELYEKSDFVYIVVSDTGIGMTAEERKHLFEKFYRVRTKETQDIKGTGLGLWITKQLVEMMKGEIFVDSMKGVGTQFTIKFPKLKNEIKNST